MRKILILMLVIMSAGIAYGSYGYEKEKVAIYTIDNSEQNIVEFVEIFLINAIVKRGTFIAVERTTDFLKELSKEQDYQHSGNVDDNKISRLGKQFGVQFVCTVKIGKIGAQLFISARLIEVETVSLKSMTRPVRFNFNEIEKSCETIVALLFDERRVSGLTSGTSNYSSGSQTNGAAYNPDGIELVYVEGIGNGSKAIKGFYIGKYEITQAQWQAIMGNNPSAKQDPFHPVTNVSWNDVKQFLAKLNEQTGGSYRLPTEAEWVYAANGGSNDDIYEYAGNDNIDEVAWYEVNSGWYSGSTASHTHRVGIMKPNSIGVYDMSGNVWEWCEDCYDSSCSERVNRGGSWGSLASRCSVTCRHSSSPDSSYDRLGFRLVGP
jgi:hypothetical protein